MGGHHKKNLRAEKAKVKLKGAKLPKGLNVTKTDFKVRKITIRDQLKDSQYVEGQRVVDLKETLSRLKHHSSSYRMEALRNLKVSLAAADAKILSNLNALTQGISAICLDLDKDTRRESFKVLSSFLNALTIESVTPFFHVISSYLRCAMTHIQPSIQEDSLLMLDVLLQHVPHLIAENSGKIFQNFLEMISKVRAEGDKAGRMLTVNMGNKQTTIVWRSKILLRLQHMLHILAANKKLRSSGGVGAGNNLKQLTHTFNNKAPQYFPLLRAYGVGEMCDLNAIFCKSVSDASNKAAFLGGSSIVGSARDDFEVLQRYISHLMPLLLETWLEVRPQTTTTASATGHLILSYDAAFALKVVLDIIKNLWTLVDIHEQEVNNTDLSSWYRGEYAESFASHFMQAAFPYQQCEINVKANSETSSARGRQKSKKAQPDAGGQFCIQQNVNLAYLMSRFFDQNIVDQASHFSSLLQYLTTIVDNLKAYPLESFIYLEPALRSILYQNGLQLLQVDAAKERALLNSTINAFLTNQFPTNEGVAARILVLICDIAQKAQLFAGFDAEDFNLFISYLPQLLLRPSITEQALLSMSNLGKQKNAVFAQALQQLVTPVIENLQKIQVQGACNAFEGKKHIMNLFYWLDCAWSRDVQCGLKQKVQDCVTDKRIAGYCNFIISKS